MRGRAPVARPLRESDPTLRADLDRLADSEGRGVSERPLRWTSKSHVKLVGALRSAGHRISPRSVAPNLREWHPKGEPPRHCATTSRAMRSSAALRSAFPALERVAYLNTRSVAAVPRAAAEAAQVELCAQLNEGRAKAQFERLFELATGCAPAWPACSGYTGKEVALTGATTDRVTRSSPDSTCASETTC